MKLTTVFFVFLFSINIFSENLYMENFPILLNPSTNAFENNSKLAAFYNPKIKDLGVYLSTDFLFFNISFLSEYNTKTNTTLYSFSSSMSLGDYISIGTGYFNYNTSKINNITNPLKNSWINLGFTIRNSYGYFGYTHIINSSVIKDSLKDFESNGLIINDNYFSNSIQFGLMIHDISPFISINELNYNWSFNTGVILLNFYGVDLSYQYSRKNKENTHEINLKFNLPYFNIGIKTKNTNLNLIYTSLHSKKSRNSLFDMSNYYLKIKLDKKLTEIGNGGIITGENYSFIDLVIIIRKAIKDNFIKGFIFEIEKPSLSSSQAEELINLLKTTNKKYFVYLKSNSLGDYLFASNASRISIHPAVDLSINGPNIVMMFYKNLMSYLGINAYFFKRGNYKTAPEEYTEYAPTKYNLREINKLLKVIKNFIELTIRNNKNIPNISQILDNAPYSPKRAIHLGLVDDISYLDDFEDSFKFRNIEIITPSIYNSMFYKGLKLVCNNNIAVLTIEGEITENKGSFLGITENYRKKILNSIKEIRNNPFIKGVIIRINSPGGSGFVSDEINHAIKKLTMYKLVYVSIGSIDASGGYYISVAGNKIFANKMSILGSIGVFSGKFVIKTFLDKFLVGIFTKTIWKNGNLMSMFDLPTSNQLRKLDESVNNFYEIFLSKVNEGRGISIKKLKTKIAGGRVYLGEEGKKLHLIDEIGGFNDTLNALIKKASLKANVKIVAYPENNNFLITLLTGKKKLLFKLNTIINLLKSPNLLISNYEIDF